MIICNRPANPFANDHKDLPVYCKWSSGFLPFNQILLHFSFYFQQTSYFHPTNIIFKTFFLLLQIWGSRFNIVDLSITNVFLFTLFLSPFRVYLSLCLFVLLLLPCIFAFLCNFQLFSALVLGADGEAAIKYKVWCGFYAKYWINQKSFIVYTVPSSSPHQPNPLHSLWRLGAYWGKYTKKYIRKGNITENIKR